MTKRCRKPEIYKSNFMVNHISIFAETCLMLEGFIVETYSNILDFACRRYIIYVDVPNIPENLRKMQGRYRLTVRPFPSLNDLRFLLKKAKKRPPCFS